MIRINLLAPERPTSKKKAASSAPGALQAYLFLVLFGGGAIAGCGALWWWKTAQIADLDSKIAQSKKRQAELQAIKVQVDQFLAKKTHPRREGQAHRAAPRPAVGSRSPARRDLQVPSRSGMAHRPRADRGWHPPSGREQRAHLRGGLHREPAAVRLVPAGRPRELQRDCGQPHQFRGPGPVQAAGTARPGRRPGETLRRGKSHG